MTETARQIGIAREANKPEALELSLTGLTGVVGFVGAVAITFLVLVLFVYNIS
jgi:hypothetical protein